MGKIYEKEECQHTLPAMVVMTEEPHLHVLIIAVVLPIAIVTIVAVLCVVIAGAVIVAVADIVAASDYREGR